MNIKTLSMAGVACCFGLASAHSSSYSAFDYLNVLTRPHEFENWMPVILLIPALLSGWLVMRDIFSSPATNAHVTLDGDKTRAELADVKEHLFERSNGKQSEQNLPPSLSEEDLEDFEIIIPSLPRVFQSLMDAFRIHQKMFINDHSKEGWFDDGEVIFEISEDVSLHVQMGVSGMAYFPSKISLDFCSWESDGPKPFRAYNFHAPMMTIRPLKGQNCNLAVASAFHSIIFKFEDILNSPSRVKEAEDFYIQTDRETTTQDEAKQRVKELDVEFQAACTLIDNYNIIKIPAQKSNAQRVECLFDWDLYHKDHVEPKLQSRHQ